MRPGRPAADFCIVVLTEGLSTYRSSFWVMAWFASSTVSPARVISPTRGRLTRPLEGTFVTVVTSSWR